MKSAVNSILLGLTVTIGVTAPFATGAFAYTEKTLYKFCQEKHCADGSRPHDLAMDAQGNLYGTTFWGGLKKGGSSPGYGTVFEFSPSTGTYQTLYNFCSQPNCTDGANPYRVKLVVDVNGNLYGTTRSGGSASPNDVGVVFELLQKKGWQEKVLHTFCKGRCTDQGVLQTGLTYQGAQTGAFYDGVSPLYGTTNPQQFGTVYELLLGKSGNWTFKTLYSFCSQDNCSDGAQPIAPVYLDDSGNIYGTTELGGQFNKGTVFVLKPLGNGSYDESVIHSFCTLENCKDGELPDAGVVIDNLGNIFGSASYDNVSHDGVLFELSASSGDYDIIADFNGRNGSFPTNLLLGNGENLFGVTYNGGSRDKGTVFQYSDATLDTIYNVCQEHKCPDGAHPLGGLVEDANGILFGSNEVGGIKNGGTIFELVNEKPVHRTK